MIHLSSTEGIRLARVCNQERTRQYPRLPGLGGHAPPASSPPWDPEPRFPRLHPRSSPARAPAPFPTARFPPQHTHPARGTLSNSRRGCCACSRDGGGEGGQGLAHIGSAPVPGIQRLWPPQESLKPFSLWRLKKHFSLGLYISLLGISRCGHRIPPATSLVFPRIGMGPIAQSPVRFLCAVRKKKKKILPRGAEPGTNSPSSACARLPGMESPFQGSRSYLWVSCMQLPSLLLLPPPV